MKTPRDILLGRHQSIEPKLDRIRSTIVTDLKDRATAHEHNLPLSILFTLWRELVWPCRVTWAGLSAIWIALAAFNISHAEHGQSYVARPSTPLSDVRVAFQEQERILAELLGPTTVTLPTEPPRHIPQPRSAVLTETKA